MRVKTIIDPNKKEKNKNINKKPKIMPFGYSKKEKELLNKNKKINDGNKEIVNDNNLKKDIQSKDSEASNFSKEKENIIKENEIKKSNNEINEDNFSFENISDENENDNCKNRICNTSVKNKSNLNDIESIENKQLKTGILFKKEKITVSKDVKGYEIAHKRLEELSSEITIHEELQNSITIPNENSLDSSLSQT